MKPANFVPHNAANVPRQWHTEDRLSSIGHSLIHVSSMVAAGRLGGTEPIACAKGVRPPLRTGNQSVHGAHLWSGGLYAILRPGDPSYPMCKGRYPGRTPLWVPASDCWQSKANREWTSNLSRDTDLVAVLENQADSYKERHGEKALVGLVASLANWEASGNLAHDISHIQNRFLTMFMPEDLRIIDTAMNAAKEMRGSAPNASARERYDTILELLEQDRKYETRIARRQELPEALEQNAMRQTAEMLVENEAAAGASALAAIEKPQE